MDTVIVYVQYIKVIGSMLWISRNATNRDTRICP